MNRVNSSSPTSSASSTYRIASWHHSSKSSSLPLNALLTSVTSAYVKRVSISSRMTLSPSASTGVLGRLMICL